MVHGFKYSWLLLPSYLITSCYPNLLFVGKDLVEKNELLTCSFCNFYVVGVQKARKIAGSYNLPMVGVHHMEAHALVARYQTKSSGDWRIIKLTFFFWSTLS